MTPGNMEFGRYAFLKQLRDAGVKCIFGNPGTSEQNLLDALSESQFSGLRYYMALQEGSAVAMADAYARAHRSTAVVQLHSYAGLGNGVGMMYYAKRGYTPMVVFAGEAGLKYDAMDGQMAGDLVNMARPWVKSDANGPCAWRVVDSNSIVRLLRRALKTAATPPCGPVFLALPCDVLDVPTRELIEVNPAPLRSTVIPEDGVLAEAATLLVDAKDPLILVGDGIAASEASAELVRVAEALGAPVYGVNNSEINMPLSHPLFAGDTGHMFGFASLPITSGADVVLVCGTTLMPEVFPEIGNIFRSDAKVIHFDLNTAEIGKNFSFAIGALADLKPTLKCLVQLIHERQDDAKRQNAAGKLQAARVSKETRLNGQRKVDEDNFGAVPLRLPEFMKALASRLPGVGRIISIFDEALTHSPEVIRYLRFDEPGTYFQTRAGMLGTGLPGTIGLKIARPSDLVIGFVGDGGSMQTIQALASAARYEIGAKFIVCNNGRYRILDKNLLQYRKELGIPRDRPLPREFDLQPPKLDFAKLAHGQGVKARRVEAAGDFAQALEEMLTDDGPYLIDLVLDPAH